MEGGSYWSENEDLSGGGLDASGWGWLSAALGVAGGLALSMVPGGAEADAGVEAAEGAAGAAGAAEGSAASEAAESARLARAAETSDRSLTRSLGASQRDLTDAALQRAPRVPIDGTDGITEQYYTRGKLLQDVREPEISETPYQRSYGGTKGVSGDILEEYEGPDVRNVEPPLGDEAPSGAHIVEDDGTHFPRVKKILDSWKAPGYSKLPDEPTELVNPKGTKDISYISKPAKTAFEKFQSLAGDAKVKFGKEFEKEYGFDPTKIRRLPKESWASAIARGFRQNSSRAAYQKIFGSLAMGGQQITQEQAEQMAAAAPTKSLTDPDTGVLSRFDQQDAAEKRAEAQRDAAADRQAEILEELARGGMDSRVATSWQRYRDRGFPYG